MSRRKEKISAFLDNDLHRDELMSFSLSAEADDAKVAQRYQMVGDALRGEMSDACFIDISYAVREALADEDITEQSVAAAEVLAAQTSSTQAQSSSVAAKAGLFDISSWFKPVAGMAVAASVAVVIVVSVTQQDGMLNAPLNMPLANNNEVLPAVQLAVDDSAIEQKTNVNVATDLNPYINHHLEFANQGTLQGRLPYVRAVSFESNNKVNNVPGGSSGNGSANNTSAPK